ncbi:MAG: diguanylate cyclase [Thermoanaerobaculia bacterium]
MKVFDQRVHRGGPQTFDVAQNRQGILYFGNLAGLLSYDGAWWRLIKLPHDASADQVESDDSGRIAIGTVGELGYLEPNAEGANVFRSLLPLLAPADRDFGDMKSIRSTGNGFLFLTDRLLLHWDGHSSLRIVRRFADDQTTPHRMFMVGRTPWLVGDSGAETLDLKNGATNPIPALAGKKVKLVFPQSGGGVVVAIDEQGLYSLRDGRLEPLSSSLNAWFSGKAISGGCRLLDGRYVLLARDHGVVLIRADGTIEQVIDESAGLPQFVLWNAFADREGALWLTFDGPIVRIDFASPVTILDSRRGIKGSISTVNRWRDRLYIGTTRGLFTLSNERNQEEATKVGGLPSAAWCLLPFDRDLVIGTVKGVYILRDRGDPQLVPGTDRFALYSMARSTSDPSLVWMGTDKGLFVLRRRPAGWHLEGAVDGVRPYVSSIVERDHVLWLGTVYDGLLRVDDPLSAKPRITTYANGEEIGVFTIGGRLLVVRPSGEISDIDATSHLVPDPRLAGISLPDDFFLLAEDGAGNIWINSTPPRLIRKHSDGTFSRDTEPLVQVDASDIQFMSVDSDGVVWFGGDRGLFRYQPSQVQTHFAQPIPLVRRAVTGDGRLVYGGGATSALVHLPFAFRRLRVEFAPASYHQGIEYQYRLDPSDTDWGKWSTEPFVDFTNLSEGTYTLRMRARDAEKVSPETTWSFAVDPPWYRRPWAIALWFLVVVGAVVIVVRLRTRALSRDAEELRRLVGEQTEELSQRVEQLREIQEELVEKNAQLEEANAQLELQSLVDELTGVNNRRSFQRELADEWNRALRRNDPISLILIDLDRFKDLNDRLGHQAGDAYLRELGALLMASIRRAGDVVARYGGEEFVLLLPRTEEEHAVRIAEALRSKIESMEVPGLGRECQVTASCGVATMRPVPGDTVSEFVGRVDRALYAAKRSGRNRVCVADEEGAKSLL